MGLFDMFKKGKKNEVVESKKIVMEMTDKMRDYTTRNGDTVFEYQEAQPKPGQFYDTTQVIPKRKIETRDNIELYECLVAWFNEHDAVFVGGRQYTRVIAGIDPNLMQTDSEYARVVIKELLSETRVKDYLESAMKTEEELAKERKDPNDFAKCPHGRYIGDVYKKENGRYGKGFYPEVGMEMHYSTDMVEERAEYRNNADERRRKAIDTRKAEMARLQAEIDAYEMDK